MESQRTWLIFMVFVQKVSIFHRKGMRSTFRTFPRIPLSAIDVFPQ